MNNLKNNFSIVSPASHVIFPVLTLCLLGCATSRYHLGYNYLDENNQAVNNVSKKVDTDAAMLEKKCIEALLTYDVRQLRSILTEKLLESMTDEIAESINASLRNRYLFDGQYAQSVIYLKHLKGLPDAGDNFDIYDFITAQFIVSGKPGAGVKLFMTKVKNELKLCGFFVLPLPEDNAPHQEAIGYLIPETLDKYGIFKRSRFGTSYSPR